MKRIQTKRFGLTVLLGIVAVMVVEPKYIFAQKNAPSIFSTTPKINKIDEDVICFDGTLEIEKSKYCRYYKSYKSAYGNDAVGAQDARNQMLELVKVDLDANFKAVTDGRVDKTRWFETLFDILGIAAALGGEIINGERVKTIIAGASGAAQTGRNTFNKNFRLLETSALVNQMKADRTNQWTEIIKNMAKNPTEYGWDAAKGDLLQYYICGTFNNAMNTLVEQTANNIAAAEIVQTKVIAAVSQQEYENKLRNFKDQILPRLAKFEDLQKTIDTANALLNPPAPGVAMALGPARDAKQKEKDDASNAQKAILDGYRSISLAILASGGFDVIESTIRTKYVGTPVVPRLDAFLTNLRADRSISAIEYDFFLTKVNAVVGGNPDLNKDFKEILVKNNIPTP